ncbi:hypothetical protein Barb6XT_02084 [Bacteroidales bacterium Barb6XT]|nr:hypothetical protein Barb6XT_02084 [Bacteroidales bacterium Barb6XT]
MALYDKIRELAYTLKVLLYDNNFPDVDGRYFALPQTENSANVDSIVKSGAARGEIIGNVDEAKQHVHSFLAETVRVLLAGYSANLHFFRLAAGVTGTFDPVNDSFDKKKHAIKINFYILNALREIIEEEAKGVIQGVAAVDDLIEHILNIATKLFDDILTPGHEAHITGSKIKVVGTTPDIGVFFINVLDDRFKVTETGTNTAGLISIHIPDNLAPGLYTIEIVTKYSVHGSKELKEARIATKGEQLITTPARRHARQSGDKRRPYRYITIH